METWAPVTAAAPLLPGNFLLLYGFVGEQSRTGPVRPTTSHLVLGCACVREVQGKALAAKGSEQIPPHPPSPWNPELLSDDCAVTSAPYELPQEWLEEGPYFARVVSFSNI